MSAAQRIPDEAPEGRPMTPEQVADYVQLSRQTVMRAIRAGELEASQLTQRRDGWRIWPRSISLWMERRSNRTRAPRPLAQVTPIGAGAGAAERARRHGAGTLRVTSDMGRDATTRGTDG